MRSLKQNKNRFTIKRFDLIGLYFYTLFRRRVVQPGGRSGNNVKISMREIMKRRGRLTLLVFLYNILHNLIKNLKLFNDFFTLRLHFYVSFKQTKKKNIVKNL